MTVPERLHAPDHARSAAEGHDGHAGVGASAQNGLHLVGGSGLDHGVRGGGGVARADADEVRVALAGAVLYARLAVLEHVVRPDGGQDALADRPRQRGIGHAHVL